LASHKENLLTPAPYVPLHRRTRGGNLDDGEDGEQPAEAFAPDGMLGDILKKTLQSPN
jgi:hypothetical protein